MVRSVHLQSEIGAILSEAARETKANIRIAEREAFILVKLFLQMLLYY